MDKKALRTSISSKKALLSKEQISMVGQELCAELVKTEAYQKAAAVFLYVSFNQEIDTSFIMDYALKDGKIVAVPKVYGKEMRFHVITGLTDLEPGYMSIPEPKDTLPEIVLQQNDLLLMPGLAFDCKGNRCGYGGGFYDRYLSEHPCSNKIAMGYSFQLVDVIAAQDHDIPVDSLLISKQV